METLKESKVLRGDKKKKLTAHARDYHTFLNQNDRILARCFGGMEVVESMRESLRDVMQQKLGMKLAAA